MYWNQPDGTFKAMGFARRTREGVFLGLEFAFQNRSEELVVCAGRIETPLAVRTLTRPKDSVQEIAFLLSGDGGTKIN